MMPATSFPQANIEGVRAKGYGVALESQHANAEIRSTVGLPKLTRHVFVPAGWSASHVLRK